MKPRYGVLLVCGSHTHQENYAAAFAADPRCRLVAVTDEAGVDRRRRELNERLAKALNVPYIADLKQALTRKDVHVVSVCAPPERRGRIIVLCADAGKHLYLDKSLAPQLKGLFGDHTFFLATNGLNIVEPAGPANSGAQVGKLINLANWSDENAAKLEPHEPELTDVVVELGTDGSDAIH